ncbi:MAG: hypothetical protein IT336_16375, partial [Thermomicrobiales bacterium]|nr:hypothetical protein [Thermomicrobiales bacterium]
MPDALDGRYRGAGLRAVTMPLGGIGTGSIAIAGDGSLRQWQIHNQANHLGCVPHSFFAIWARGNRPPEEPVVRVLQSPALIDLPGQAPPTANDHVVPPAHRRLLERLPGVMETEFEGRYPIANVTFRDDALPVDVSLEAFNPFIPLRSDDSGIPAILFNVTIGNPTNRVMLVSIVGTLQNAIGWDGIAPIVDDRCDLYGGNANHLVQTGDQTIIAMDNAWLPRDDPRAGSMAFAVDSPGATWLTQWNELDGFWADFTGDGQLSNRTDSTPSAEGRTWNGALAVPMKLQPGDVRTVRFTLAWHIPNRVINWSQRHYFKFDDPKSRFYLGNRYTTRFRSATDVALVVARERERLTGQTRLARDTLYDTTLPFSLIDAVTAQISIARSPTCFWTESGAFYGFEGCNGISTTHIEPMHGSCPLNCTHVWNYEMAVARLFPDLERTMRDTEWEIQQHPTGYLPHRVLLPTYLPRPWDREMGGPANPALDGLLGAILKSYREYLACGDDAWLGRHWPRMKLALDHLWSAHDPERTGVIEGEQPNTYDISIYGANTFIGTLYLAALRVMEELAKRQGEPELASACHAVFERGRARLETLWNGEFYVQEVDFNAYPVQNWGIGCHTDQLLGQWWAHMLDLGYLYPPARVKGALTAVMKYNYLADFTGFKQAP